MLIKNGADINAKDYQGITPIFVPCFDNNLLVFNYFVKNDASFNQTASRNWTPLHFAIKQKSSNIIKALIQLKADPKPKTVKGINPITIAQHNKDLKNLLLLKTNK